MSQSHISGHGAITFYDTLCTADDNFFVCTQFVTILIFLIDEATCDDMKTVRSATAAVTIFFTLIGIVSLTGSIYGCIGTCCGPQVTFLHAMY